MPPREEPGPMPSGDLPADSGRDQVEDAVSDLADRLGVSPAGINVISQEDVTWPDASVGCPEPGRIYAQVLVPGRRIVLESGGRRYAYHSGGNQRPFLCPHPAS
jgi:hypothetical protein